MTQREGGRALSAAQHRLWFLWQLHPDGAEYNVPKITRLRGPLDVPALRNAVAGLAERHRELRAVFPMGTDGLPEQRVLERTVDPMVVIDLSSAPDAVREAQVHAVATTAALAPFDLVEGPVFRATLVRVAPDDHVLVLVFHHIVIDGWSMGIVDREITALYSAAVRQEPDPLPDPAVQYEEYVREERTMLDGERGRAALEFWREQLAGAPAQLALPFDRPHYAADSAGGVRGVDLSQTLCGDILGLGRTHRVTRFLAFMAAYAALLHRTTSATDLVIGVPVSGRTSLQTENVVGLFVNMLPVRVRVEPDTTFAELLVRVRDAFLAAHAYQDFPFQRMVEELRPERAGGRHPVFQAVFAYEEPAALAAGLPDLTAAGLDLPMDTAKFELTLHVEWFGDSARSAFGYQSSVFDPETAARLAERFRALLTDAVAAPETPVGRLTLLGPDEERTLLHEWADGGPAKAGRVDDAVRRYAADQPETVAIRAEGRTLTYGELDRDANLVASALTALDVAPGALVATCLPRGIELVTAQLGAFKAQAAYLPLDPAHPAGRLAEIAAEARPALVVTDREHAEIFAGSGSDDTPGVPVRTLAELLAAGDAERVPEPSTATDDLAYVIFTSGSTGKPKGVMVEHGSLSGLLDWYRAEFGHASGERTALIAAPGFDAAVLDTWAPLTSGATLEIPPAETVLDPMALRDWLIEREIAFALVPTPLLTELAQLSWPAEVPLRAVMAGGDRLPPIAAELPFRLVNGYGPTECTVCVTAGTVPTGPDATQPPSIGRPIDGVLAYVLDPQLRPSPAGVPGELYIGGFCVARGYLGRPDLTAHRFVPDLFSAEPGARLYRTGDRVRWRSDGSLDFLGRTDRQIKIRGFRIEPGEIEKALLDLPEIAEAVVEAVAVGGAGAEPELVAYVVPAEAGTILKPAALRETLGRRLPKYMVPTRFAVLESFARTVNGKIDRAALPAVRAEDAPPAAAGRPPRTALEKLVAGVWAEVLGHGAIGVDDNFFDVGGHSMRLLAVRDRLAARFGRPVPIVELYEHTTVSALAQHLGGDGEDHAVAAPREAKAGNRIQGAARLRALRAKSRQVEADTR